MLYQSWSTTLTATTTVAQARLGLPARHTGPPHATNGGRKYIAVIVDMIPGHTICNIHIKYSLYAQEILQLCEFLIENNSEQQVLELINIK